MLLEVFTLALETISVSGFIHVIKYNYYAFWPTE